MKPKRIALFVGYSMIIYGVSSIILDNLYYNSTEEIKTAIEDLSIKDKDCLIEALYYEGRNLSNKEQNAIYDVIINRAQHSKFPSEICEVVQQPKQFSFRNGIATKESILPEVETLAYKDRVSLEKIKEIVDYRYSLGYTSVVLPSTALYYHTKKIKPVWSKKLRAVNKGIDKSFKHKYYSEIH